MKYLRAYNESKSSKNQDYIDVIDILQYIFDDYDITLLPEVEEYVDYNDFLAESPQDKTPYYVFLTKSATDIEIDTPFVGDFVRDINSDYYFEALVILNATNEIVRSIKKEIERIEDHTGKKVSIGNGSGHSIKHFDISIELTNELDEVFNAIKPNLENFKLLSDEDKKRAVELYQELDRILNK